MISSTKNGDFTHKITQLTQVTDSSESTFETRKFSSTTQPESSSNTFLNWITTEVNKASAPTDATEHATSTNDSRSSSKTSSNSSEVSQSTHKARFTTSSHAPELCKGDQQRSPAVFQEATYSATVCLNFVFNFKLYQMSFVEE